MNRGYDTIAVFRVLKGGEQEGSWCLVSTFGQTPRHFATSPDNRFLVGANQDLNNLVVFRRHLELLQHVCMFYFFSNLGAFV